VPIELALGRPGPLLKPGTSQYSACCGYVMWYPSVVHPQNVTQPAQYKYSTNILATPNFAVLLQCL